MTLGIRILSRARSAFHLKVLESVFIKTLGSLAMQTEGVCFRSATVLKLPPKVLALVD